MKNLNIYIILLVILVSSCGSDYSDHKIIIDEVETYGLFENIVIGLGVQGENELLYDLEIKYKSDLLAKQSIASNFKPEFKTVKLDLSKIENETIDFSADLVRTGKVGLEIVISNEHQKIVLDSSINLSLNLPPISRPISFTMSKGSTDLVSPLQRSLIEVRRKHPGLGDKMTHRVAFLSEMLKQKQRGLHISKSNKDLEPVKPGYEISATLILDTVSKYTVIGRYPAINNTHYKEVNLEEMLPQYIETNLGSIESAWAGKRDKRGFIINDVISSEFTGLVGIFLTNIDEYGQFTYQQIGSYLSDAIAPQFVNSTYCSEPSNPEYEGVVCIDSKSFYGWSPFSVPFVGRAYGDIKGIYVDNMNVNFKIGEEIYFKKKIYLDGGYNRVPVKIIDNSGNITESYIPITIEDMEGNDIDINNNINIENN